MRLTKSFEKLLTDTVNLNQTRIDRVISAHNTVREALEAHEEVAPRLVGTYLQGSYAYGTAVRPGGSYTEYDVDAVIALYLEREDGSLPNGYNVVEWIARVIESIDRYEGKVERKTTCARVDYESDDGRFHLDIVPGHQSGSTSDAICIPPDWEQSHPRGYKGWLQDRKDEHCERVKHLVRIMKYWRNKQCTDGFGSKWGPNSMILTTLVAKHAPADGNYHDSLDEALIETMESMLDFFAAHDEDNPYRVPEVANPSLESEDLARNWKHDDYRRFRNLLDEAAATGQKALRSKDEQESIDLWNSEVLFDGEFPKTKRGLGKTAKRAGAAMASGGLHVGTSNGAGRRSEERTQHVPDNGGFYGESKD
jgi:hypothetical protein